MVVVPGASRLQEVGVWCRKSDVGEVFAVVIKLWTVAGWTRLVGQDEDDGYDAYADLEDFA
jgi:hypothetical protein